MSTFHFEDVFVRVLMEDAIVKSHESCHAVEVRNRQPDHNRSAEYEKLGVLEIEPACISHQLALFAHATEGTPSATLDCFNLSLKSDQFFLLRCRETELRSCFESCLFHVIITLTT
jgi:hypothetical protein